MKNLKYIILDESYINYLSKFDKNVAYLTENILERSCDFFAIRRKV